MQSIFDVLNGEGIASEKIRMSSFNIYFDPQAGSYNVNNQIQVELEDVQSAGRVLAAALRAGANIAGGVNFALSDSSETEAEALRRAVGDARSRAETLASSLGVTVGDVVSVDMNTGGMYNPGFSRERGLMSAAPARVVPLGVGDITIALDIQVTYEIGSAR
jgi:uncharacterized protein YggE